MPIVWVPPAPTPPPAFTGFWTTLGGTTVYAEEFEPSPPPIQVMEPEVGEIIAWRCWRYSGGYLQSLVSDYVWLPNEPVTGDLEKIVHRGIFGDHVKGGVFAWQNKQYALQHGTEHIEWMSQRQVKTTSRREIVLGTVYLWGMVMQHERGFRAENASVRSIEDILGWPGFPKEAALTQLRTRYLSEPTDD